MLKKKIIPVFLASVLTVSGTTGFVTEAFSENALVSFHEGGFAAALYPRVPCRISAAGNFY